MDKFLVVFYLSLGVILPATIVSSPLSAWAPQCPASTSGKIPRLIPDPTNCRSALICTQEGPRRYYCPMGQVFLGAEQKCVSQRACTEGIDKFTPFTSCPEVDGKDLISFPHPTDCHMFYVCNHGAALLRRCPSSLHFNPVKKVCDWPHSADCKARVLTLQP
ncbi:peritrophin-1 [Nephila pilipes]|uniref:Peritrophin-1 n=1 Tax=Nephila pilipes TaxID=299642 RepID=A0A8X6TUW2_NEPPI|nr:peritrophin-1 [Nephila pilipes]